ncbi:MAG: hypothetical protein FJY25_15615 [Betaproteobacteria bacterium]|nr:hypothetical protein [Betaproteobacteria bacterium]
MRPLANLIACWLLTVVLPIQALAGIVRLPAAHAGEHHPVELADPSGDCPHHRAATPCADCGHPADPLSDRDEFPDSSRCNTCSFCCMLLIPASWSLPLAVTTSTSPAQAASKFRSIAPRGLERPPRAALLLPA